MDKNIILYGPPGTGKTYNSIKYAVAIIEEKPLSAIQAESDDSVFERYKKYYSDGLIAFITFHQSFSYEEFIEGIRPILSIGDSGESGRDIEYEIHDGIFKKFCNADIPLSNRIFIISDIPLSNRVFIIDEINRGNISKIFGELITLIESSKRIGAKEELRAKLPYSGDKFGIPDNVYLIGTMNTADRSIALLDTALRRRFHFIEMQPDYDLLQDITINGSNINIKKLLNVMNKRIQALLDREHTIGHAYFLPLEKEPTIENLAAIFQKNILPLLQEYFYDDYEKIQLVLGDNQKTDNEYRFITKLDDISDSFGTSDVDVKDYYEINKKAFREIKAYDFLQ